MADIGPLEILLFPNGTDRELVKSIFSMPHTSDYGRKIGFVNQSSFSKLFRQILDEINHRKAGASYPECVFTDAALNFYDGSSFSYNDEGLLQTSGIEIDAGVSNYLPRSEICRTSVEFLPNKMHDVCKYLMTRFPTEKFGTTFPLAHSMQAMYQFYTGLPFPQITVEV